MLPKKLAELDRQNAWLEAQQPIDTDIERNVWAKFQIDWNYHSNAMEGNTLTYGETERLIQRGITAKGKPLKDHLEITGHDAIIRTISSMARERYPFTLSDIRNLYRQLLGQAYNAPAVNPDGSMGTKRIKVGEFKSTPNHVELPDGSIFRYAAPEEVPALMTDLMDWLREQDARVVRKETHALDVAADFHYQFVRIHPFDDGNGRLARILMNLILVHHGYLVSIIPTDEKALYLDALTQADRTGDTLALKIFLVNTVLPQYRLFERAIRGERIHEPRGEDD